MTWSLLLALSLALPGHAARRALPDAIDVLRESLEGPDEPYAAELTVTRPEGSRRMSVRFSPPGLYRRELLGPRRQLLQLVVDDGTNEWVYDPARGRVWQGQPADPFSKRFGPDEELDRLAENYDLAIASGGQVARRSTWQLELRSRADRSLARRLWVDRRSSLILRSETYRPDGSLAAAMRCTRLQLGAQPDPALFRFSPPAGSTVTSRVEADFMALDEAKAAGVEPRLPAWLPSGYVFESLDVIPKGRSSVAHYRFSDGVHVLSLFQCPPRVRLDLGRGARKPVKLAGGRGTSVRTDEGGVLAWNASGWRFMLVGPFSDATLRLVAESVR